MTKPRDPAPDLGEGRGASDFATAKLVAAARDRLSEGAERIGRAAQRVEQSERVEQLVERGRERWDWLRRLRAWRAYSRFTDVGGTVLAAGMSYQALFAVFAGLYVGFGIVGIWLQSRPELLEQLIEQINLFVPGLLGDNGIVTEAAVLSVRVLSWTSAIAALSLLWVAITWFTGTRRAIRIIFGLEVKQYRNAVLLKLRDFALALAFFVAILVSAGLTLLSSNLMGTIIDWLGWDPDSWLVSGIGTTARYASMYVFDVAVLVAIHTFLAEVRVRRWLLLRGCALGGAALFVLKVLGTLLLGSATSNPLLATFAVLIGLLVWFNLVCRALLLTASWVAVGADRSLGLGRPTGFLE
ncbi:YihY/virulence factor BrkB family protein [Leucobacter allii]|uniref:YihY/virulence factor BrkB family protein n=1 Tax=Leucobacter allii TaxID=2932247 RepID=UPI001FD2AEA8|nr:YihY/virulence factor BrkB family protein [Leucobacter allii]UOR02114.1 YihY/virulence factor BrkB family protein [Leucobacter allii]